jgi:hypothetical protein
MGDYNEKNQGQQQAIDREGGQEDRQQEAPGRNPDGGKSAGGQQGADKDKQGGQDREGGHSTGEPGEKEETRR